MLEEAIRLTPRWSQRLPAFGFIASVAGLRTVSVAVAQLWIVRHHDMRRIVSLLLIVGAFSSALMLAGCGGIGFAYEKHLSGKYELVAVDTLDQMNVSQALPGGDAIGVIPSTVFSVGWDGHFIIAKQHPKDASHHIDKSVTKFYILRLSDGKLAGPLDEAAFDRERIKLGVADGLSFTLSFDSLK